MQGMVAGERSQGKPRQGRAKYVWYDGSSKQSGGGQASLSQRHLGSDILTRICSEKKNSLMDKCLNGVHVDTQFARQPGDNTEKYKHVIYDSV